MVEDKEKRSRSHDRGKKNNSVTPPSRSSRKYSRSSSSTDDFKNYKYHSKSHRSLRSKSRSKSDYIRQQRHLSRYFSRSRSYSPRRSRSYDRHHERSFSRSPRYSSRKKHVGNRENPKESRCLGVFGLSIFTTESQIRQIFSKYGAVCNVQIVLDAKTGRSRGYGFIYFESCEQATLAKEHCAGMVIDERRIRVDYSITKRAHTPTPGIYMGRPTKAYRENLERGSHSDRDEKYKYSSRYSNRRSRTTSPYSRERKRRLHRSNSRSFSPRDRRYK